METTRRGFLAAAAALAAGARVLRPGMAPVSMASTLRLPCVATFPARPVTPSSLSRLRAEWLALHAGESWPTGFVDAVRRADP